MHKFSLSQTEDLHQDISEEMSAESVPLLSVVIPTLNRAGILKIAVESVLNNPLADVELVVSNNCSVDHTQEYLMSLCDHRLKVVSPTSRLSGVDHWEFALSHARGHYVLLLGDDDYLMEGFYAEVMPRLKGLEHVVLSCGFVVERWRTVGPGNVEKTLERRAFSREEQSLPAMAVVGRSLSYYGLVADQDFERQLKRFRFHPSSLIVRRQEVDRARAAQGFFYVWPISDNGYNAVFAQLRANFIHLDFPLVGVAVHDDSDTSRLSTGAPRNDLPLEKFQYVKLTAQLHVNLAAESFWHLNNAMNGALWPQPLEFLPSYYLRYFQELDVYSRRPNGHCRSFLAEFWQVVDGLSPARRMQVRLKIWRWRISCVQNRVVNAAWRVRSSLGKLKRKLLGKRLPN